MRPSFNAVDRTCVSLKSGQWKLDFMYGRVSIFVFMSSISARFRQNLAHETFIHFCSMYLSFINICAVKAII